MRAFLLGFNLYLYLIAVMDVGGSGGLFLFVCFAAHFVFSLYKGRKIKTQLVLEQRRLERCMATYTWFCFCLLSSEYALSCVGRI